MRYGLVLNGNVLEECESSIFPDTYQDTAAEWLPFIGDPPTYDPQFQTLVGPTYVVTATNIQQCWTVQFLGIHAIRENLKTELADIRYQHEVGGTTWTKNGTTYNLDTSREVQAKLSGASMFAQLYLAQVQAAQAANQPAPAVFSMNWKFLDGTFLSIDVNDLISIFSTVVMYVEECYNNESLLCAQICAAATAPIAMAIDLTVGWPASPGLYSASSMSMSS